MVPIAVQKPAQCHLRFCKSVLARLRCDSRWSFAQAQVARACTAGGNAENKPSLQHADWTRSTPKGTIVREATQKTSLGGASLLASRGSLENGARSPLAGGAHCQHPCSKTQADQMHRHSVFEQCRVFSARGGKRGSQRSQKIANCPTCDGVLLLKNTGLLCAQGKVSERHGPHPAQHQQEGGTHPHIPGTQPTDPSGGSACHLKTWRGFAIKHCAIGSSWLSAHACTRRSLHEERPSYQLETQRTLFEKVKRLIGAAHGPLWLTARLDSEQAWKGCHRKSSFRPIARARRYFKPLSDDQSCTNSILALVRAAWRWVCRRSSSTTSCVTMCGAKTHIFSHGVSLVAGSLPRHAVSLACIGHCGAIARACFGLL